MKPYLNIFDIDEYKINNNGGFSEKYFSISEKIGAKKLGYSITIIEPGFKVCPFHNHHINEEMFLILEGRGTLRFGPDKYEIKKGDIIACPPGGQEVAHQIINTGTESLKYLCLSTNEPVDICEYPDSNKVLSSVGTQDNRSFRHIARLGDIVDYFENEK